MKSDGYSSFGRGLLFLDWLVTSCHAVELPLDGMALNFRLLTTVYFLPFIFPPPVPYITNKNNILQVEFLQYLEVKCHGGK